MGKGARDPAWPGANPAITAAKHLPAAQPSVAIKPARDQQLIVARDKPGSRQRQQRIRAQRPLIGGAGSESRRGRRGCEAFHGGQVRAKGSRLPA